MSMAHYMSLLASNQPWNLILFMAIPLICAEALTISKLFIIFDRVKSGGLKTLNKIIGIFSGFLVVVHIAMIFGMVNPKIIDSMSVMPGMTN